jgi:hypothetical protein
MDLITSTLGSEPKVMLEISNDGGYSYLDLQIWATPGKLGERLTRCRWNKLGMSRDRVFRVTMTDPVKWVIIAARMDLTAEKV